MGAGHDMMNKVWQERSLIAVLVALLLERSPLGAMMPGGAGMVLSFIILFGAMIWGAAGVVRHAEAVAERLGEPFGTLILTLAVVSIEVALIASVMLSGEGSPTLARDTMFAVLMIVLNGLVGLSLLLGALRFGEQNYNFAGAGSFLIVIVPFAVLSLVLPAYTTSTFAPSFSEFQSLFFLIVTLALYGVFLSIQTVRHRGFFVEPEEPDIGDERHAEYPTLVHVALLLATLIPIVLLSKPLAKLVDHGIGAVGLPSALGGVVIATIVLAAEGLSAVRAALRNRLQRAVNLLLGAALSTIGMTVPAVLAIGVFTGQAVVLGLPPAQQVVLALSLLAAIQTFGARRTNVLHGAVHLVIFAAYIALIFAP